MTVTADPDSNFFPGEQVQVTATSSLQGSSTAVEKRVWQFRTEVSSGSGQFVNSGQTLGTNSGGRALLGDLDNDGDVDVVEGLNGVVWFNDGNAVFTAGPTLNSGGEGALMDLDGDGDLDVAGLNNVLLNDGSGNFTGTGQNFPGATLAAGDLDGDGDNDVMLGVNYGAKQVWFNDGNGNFSDSGQALGTVSSSGIEFGDFDGDGDLDAFASLNGGNGNEVWFNDGSGVFMNSGQALGGFRSSIDVDLGDVDGDGDLDAVVTNDYNVGARIWKNDGNGIFTETGVGHDPLRGRRAEFGDVDGDGDLDIVNSVLWDGSSVWLNDGTGTFSDTGQRLDFHPNNVTRRVEGGGLADLDGDGDLDYYEANIGTGGSNVWLNQNLQPSVSLSVDNSSIAEDAGTATVTATLSAAHTVPVTIDLSYSGSATSGVDYTASGSQIVIATGDTSGSVTVTAVQDPDDEPDETVIVDISGVTNADEAGTQQATTTILDDDEPIPVPDVTLSVDNPSIPEAAGVATFTATLSVVTTVPVTIELALSGSAAASDYAASGTQIVVAAGDTSGSITVTAVQDDIDEPDETVTVDIASVSGGTEAGTQQQTTTIADDDEAVVPDVTLTLNNTSIAEAGGEANFTVTLSEETSVPVTVDLAITGTAGASDYTASATQVVIAAGDTSGSITVTAVDDAEDEGDETVIVDISGVTNGNEDGTQQQTTTITDDDDPPKLTVTGVTANASGFTADFSTNIDTSLLNLYDTQNLGLGAADVLLEGASSGAIAGSLVVDASLRQVSFIKSGAPLAADTYTVTLRSGANGIVDVGGQLLDGNDDGTEGDDYSTTFTVDAPAANSVTLSIPDFVRGPGQPVNLPADTTTGIPVTISEGTNVRAVDLRVSYDPALLNITGATVSESAPAGATVIVNTNTPGLAILVFFSSNALSAGSSTFVNLQAEVPASSGIYRTQQVLDLHAVTVSDGNDNEAPVVVDDAFHLTSYLADVSGNGRINASDAAQVARFAALIESGFAGSINADPTVVGDPSGNGRVNAADASLVAQFAALIDVPQIPDVPGGIALSGISEDLTGLTNAHLEPTRAIETTARETQVSDSGDSPFGGADTTAIGSPAVDSVMTELEQSDAKGLDDSSLTSSLEDLLEELLPSAS